MNAQLKRKRPAGRIFYTTVLLLSVLATISFLNNRRGDAEAPGELAGRSLEKRDEEVRPKNAIL
jgi:hypothetical protein